MFFYSDFALVGVWKREVDEWLPAVSKKAMKSMNGKMKERSIFRTSICTLTHLANTINPAVRGWTNYYGKFYTTKLKSFTHNVNVKIASWARRKYKNLRSSEMKVIRWLYGICQTSPTFFAHWTIGANLAGKFLGFT